MLLLAVMSCFVFCYAARELSALWLLFSNLVGSPAILGLFFRIV